MKEEQKTDLAEELEVRSDLYRLLSSLFFKEASKEFIKTLKDIPKEYTELDGLLGQGYREMRSYYVHKGHDARTELAVEFAHMFLAAGMFTGDAAVPYESIYTSEKGLVMREARDEVRKVYLRNSVDVDERLNLPEDHLSFELEFLAIMSDRARELLDGDKDAEVADVLQIQRDFIESHLLNWLPSLEERVMDMAEETFYPGVVHVTMGSLDSDVGFLGDAIAKIRGRTLRDSA